MAAADRHQPEDLISVAEAARRFGVTPRTVQRWILEGRLPVYEITPRSRYVVWSAIDAELRATASGGKSATIGGSVHPIRE